MRNPGKFILYYMVQEIPNDNTSVLNLVNIGYDQRYLVGSHNEEIIALAKLPIHDGHVHTILAYHDPADDCDKLDEKLRSIDRLHCVTFYPDGYRSPLSPNSYLFRASDLDVFTCGVVNHKLPPVWVNNMNALAFAIRDPGANESAFAIAVEQAHHIHNICVTAKVGAPDEYSSTVDVMLFDTYTAAALVYMQKNSTKFSKQDNAALQINKDLLKFIARESGITFVILVASENGAGYVIEGELDILMSIYKFVYSSFISHYRSYFRF